MADKGFPSMGDRPSKIISVRRISSGISSGGGKADAVLDKTMRFNPACEFTNASRETGPEAIDINTKV